MDGAPKGRSDDLDGSPAPLDRSLVSRGIPDADIL
jgi:hypothetical protein